MLLLPLGMHIPDGFLSIPVSLLFWLTALLIIGRALQHVNHELGERQVPLMGVLAAAIFAGQMLNFTVAGGTSGHLLGAALATILLGPWAAVVVMTSVVATQALLFQDGGLVVLGANLFNMAIIGVFVAHTVIHACPKNLSGEQMGNLCRWICCCLVIDFHCFPCMWTSACPFGNFPGRIGDTCHGWYPCTYRYRGRFDNHRCPYFHLCIPKGFDCETLP